MPRKTKTVEAVVEKVTSRCTSCSRADICPQFRQCLECEKVAPILNLDEKQKTPSLKVFGQRCDEIMPIEPEYIAVDAGGIRFFVREPKFKCDNSTGGIGRWTTGYYEEMIATLRYDYLEGLFDVSPYVTDNGYAYNHMIAKLF